MVKFDLEKLRGKKVAVYCATEEQTQDFINWVVAYGEDKYIFDAPLERNFFILKDDLTAITVAKHVCEVYNYKIISYEEALLKENKSKESSKSKKIKNLHKVLRKKDEKIKNQKKEITLLLEQKAELEGQLKIALEIAEKLTIKKEPLEEDLGLQIELTMLRATVRYLAETLKIERMKNE